MAATAIIRRPEIIRQGEEILELERAALEADRGISPTGRRVLLVLAIVIDVIQLVFSALLSMLAVIPGIGLIILGLEVYASFLFSDDFINLTAWLCGIKPQGRLKIDRSHFGVAQVG